jgi:outer membrane lipoprotein SlyB
LAATLALGGTAFAQTAVQATTDLNVRAGPGPQYPVVGVLAAGQSTALKGCLSDGKWCSVGDGWVYSQYLASDFGGKTMVLSERPAEAKIAVVEAPDSGSAGAVAGGTTGAIAGAIAGGPVGALIGGVAGATIGGTMGEAVEPPAQVRQYVTSNRMDPVYLDGEVVVGATLPETVQVREIPDYKYRYVNVNGQEVLVEPSSRRIVHVVR